MYGRVSIQTDRVNANVVVPREAVKTNAQGVSTVTVVDAEDVAHVREVKLGAADSQVTEILSGVQPGDRVVTLSYRPVQDGQKVRLAGAGGGSGGEGGRGRGGAGKQAGGKNG